MFESVTLWRSNRSIDRVHLIEGDGGQLRVSCQNKEWRKAMKNLLLIIAAISSIGIAGGTPARAQVVDVIVADIPFGFTVRDTAPSGEYAIKRIDSVNPGTMQISNADGTQRLVFLVSNAEALKPPNQTKLIFDRVGDEYFLSEIFEIGNTSGVELKKSRVEQKLEKEGAMTQLHSVVVPAQTDIHAER